MSQVVKHHDTMTRLSQHLTVALLLLITGCMSQRAGNNLGYAVTSGLFGKMMDIPYWTDAFRRDKSRMPKDYPELVRFVAQQTDSKVQLAPYDHVEFALLPTGQRQAVCYWVSHDTTNSSTATWGRPGQ